MTSCRTRQLGARATEEPQKAALAAIEGLRAKKPIYVGPLKDNKTGKVGIDKTYAISIPSSTKWTIPRRTSSALGLVIATSSAEHSARDMPGELSIAK